MDLDKLFQQLEPVYIASASIILIGYILYFFYQFFSALEFDGIINFLKSFFRFIFDYQWSGIFVTLLLSVIPIINTLAVLFGVISFIYLTFIDDSSSSSDDNYIITIIKKKKY
jgi:hypothetical protein